MVTEPSTPSRSAWAPAGPKDHFTDQAASWNSKYLRSESFQARLAFVGQEVLCLLDSIEGAQVLDFGAGTGLFGLVASQKASLVVCVDQSLPMLQAGRRDPEGFAEPIRRAGLEGQLGQVIRVAGDEVAAGALHCRFDLVIAVSVLEYVRDTRRVLTNLAGTLRPGGRLVATVPNPHSPVRLATRILRPWLERRRPTTTRWAGQSYLLVRPNGDRPPWRQAAEQAGLLFDQIRQIPFTRSNLPSLLHPNLLIELVKT